MKKNRIYFLVIIIIATFFRFWQLGILPPSLTWDEVAWGYNAYSLGVDGRDEFGRFLPFDYLESFGDFKPPIFAYLDIVPIKILGLTPFAVRFPSAFFGVLTVFVSFFLVKRIFYNSKNNEKIALMTCLVLALSPWHILLSRGAFEANVATFFIVTGVWAFIASIQEKKWYLVISAFFFVLSMYTFNTARIVSPLLVIVLVIVFWKKLFIYKKRTFIAAFFGFLLILPIIPFLFSPQAALRFREVNIFSNIEIVKNANQQIENDGNTIWSKIIHNRRVFYAGEYLNHYLDNLSFDFLFVHGDGNPKFSIQEVGQMYLWDLPFFIAGLIFLIRKKEGYWWLVPVWLLLAIIPAGTARETPHALRIESALPTFQILSAYGFVSLYSIFQRKKKLFLTFSGIGLLLSVVYFSHNYFNHYPQRFSNEWQYGYQESIQYAQIQYNNFDYIYVTEKMGRPYVYYLFFTKEHPFNFRKNAVIQRDVFGFVDVKSFGKYRFVKETNSIKNKNSLYIDLPSSVPDGAKTLKTFYQLDGEPVLAAYAL